MGRTVVETYGGVTITLDQGLFTATVGTKPVGAESLRALKTKIDLEQRKTVRATARNLPCVVQSAEHRYAKGPDGEDYDYSGSYTEPVWYEGAFLELNAQTEAFSIRRADGTVKTFSNGTFVRVDDPRLEELKALGEAWTEAQLVEIRAKHAFRALERAIGYRPSIGYVGGRGKGRETTRTQAAAREEARIVAHLGGTLTAEEEAS